MAQEILHLVKEHRFGPVVESFVGVDFPGQTTCFLGGQPLALFHLLSLLLHLLDLRCIPAIVVLKLQQMK
jgi:hypothetical protein